MTMWKTADGERLKTLTALFEEGNLKMQLRGHGGCQVLQLSKTDGVAFTKDNVAEICDPCVEDMLELFGIPSESTGVTSAPSSRQRFNPRIILCNWANDTASAAAAVQPLEAPPEMLMSLVTADELISSNFPYSEPDVIRRNVRALEAALTDQGCPGVSLRFMSKKERLFFVLDEDNSVGEHDQLYLDLFRRSPLFKQVKESCFSLCGDRRALVLFGRDWDELTRATILVESSLNAFLLPRDVHPPIFADEYICLEHQATGFDVEAFYYGEMDEPEPLDLRQELPEDVVKAAQDKRFVISFDPQAGGIHSSVISALASAVVVSLPRVKGLTAADLKLLLDGCPALRTLCLMDAPNVTELLADDSIDLMTFLDKVVWIPVPDDITWRDAIAAFVPFASLNRGGSQEAKAKSPHSRRSPPALTATLESQDQEKAYFRAIRRCAENHRWYIFALYQCQCSKEKDAF